MKCLNCKNKSDIPVELQELANELKKIYSVVVYCTVNNCLVVANPDTPTQDVTECENFTQG